VTPRLHVYVHVPFCARTCPYCHFYQLGHDDGREALYLDAMEREVERWRARGAFDGARLATLYWGGGSPSLLTPQGFERLAEACLSVAPPADDLEWTLEANPADVDTARLDAWRGKGANRLSIGVQSFDDRRLAFLGREHDAATARRAVEAAAGAGFDNLTIDLMFNVRAPEEASARRRAWLGDVTTAVSLPVAHLSLYGLTIEPGTAFGARAGRDLRLTVPDAGYAAEYRAACRLTRQAGFDHYEVSSFAHPGRRARHNRAVWTGEPYLGLGPAAHSFDGRRRWANADLSAWADALATGRDPRAFVETPTPAQRRLETLELGLRTSDGVAADHPLLAGPAAADLVSALAIEGLVEVTRERVACTERGFLVLDAILERLAVLEGEERDPRRDSPTMHGVTAIDGPAADRYSFRPSKR